MATRMLELAFKQSLHVQDLHIWWLNFCVGTVQPRVTTEGRARGDKGIKGLLLQRRAEYTRSRGELASRVWGQQPWWQWFFFWEICPPHTVKTWFCIAHIAKLDLVSSTLKECFGLLHTTLNKLNILQLKGGWKDHFTLGPNVHPCWVLIILFTYILHKLGGLPCFLN